MPLNIAAAVPVWEDQVAERPCILVLAAHASRCILSGVSRLAAWLVSQPFFSSPGTLVAGTKVVKRDAGFRG